MEKINMLKACYHNIHKILIIIHHRLRDSASPVLTGYIIPMVVRDFLTFRLSAQTPTNLHENGGD